MKLTNKKNNLYPVNLQLEFDQMAMELDVPEGVWNPTPHGMHLGNMIAEIEFEGQEVLELGSGCGIHTILIAQQHPKKITITEITGDILDNTRHNLKKNDITIPVDYIVADWTHVSEGPFDILITNPPFAKSGKRYYRYFIDTMINDTHKLVKPGGRLIFVQSSMADVKRSLRLMNDWGMKVNIVGKTSGPFREYYFEDPRFMANLEKVPDSFEIIDGVYYEELTVFEATLPK